MIYLLVDLKIVLALHPSDQNRGWSERGTYPREGRLSKFEVFWGALNRGNNSKSPDHVLWRLIGFDVCRTFNSPAHYHELLFPCLFIVVFIVVPWILL